MIRARRNVKMMKRKKKKKKKNKRRRRTTPERFLFAGKKKRRDLFFPRKETHGNQQRRSNAFRSMCGIFKRPLASKLINTNTYTLYVIPRAEKDKPPTSYLFIFF